MQWIKLSEAAALTQKPERTLRYKLAKGQLIGKKDGQSWLVEFASLKNSGLVKILPSSNSLPLPIKAVNEITATKPKPTPADLGPYRNLTEWKKKVEDNELLRLTLLVQKQLAAGYFEFSRTRKADIYRSARELLAYIWVELDVSKEKNPQYEALMQELSDVIGNVSGVLKKIEGKKEVEAHA